MAMWKNPVKRKIGGKIYYLQRENAELKYAKLHAHLLQINGGLARIIPDEHLGRLHKYCVYATREPVRKRLVGGKF